jgi:septum site-determining protein MinC
MPVSRPDQKAFDLKSTSWSLTALRLHTANVGGVAAALVSCVADNPGLFDNDPVVIDLSLLPLADEAIDFPALLQELRRHDLMPVAAQGGTPGQMAAALAAGLAESSAQLARSVELPASPAMAPATADMDVCEVVNEAVREVAHGVKHEAAREVIQEVRAARGATTLVVDTPLRSGQRVYARGGDLVVLSVVSFGAEVIADGNIHVYGPLRGRAIAGASGDTSARIFSTCMDPQLVSIAGTYRTTEVPFPGAVQGHAAQVRLEGDRIVVEPLKA